MGKKKKKPFINKKEAQSYRLVPRSQHDPLAGDINESQYVLKPQITEEVLAEGDETDDRVEEQKKFGIFFEDDYDYLQHLKAPGTAVLELSESLGPAQRKVNLPNDLFGSEVRVQGHLDKVLPITGPQPDWDPEIVEALENAEIDNEPDQELEDDFVMLANAGEPGLPVYITGHYDTESGDIDWWKHREDFKYLQSPKHVLGVSTIQGREDDDDGGASDSDSLSEEVIANSNDEEVLEKMTARFTEYSMTSSVVPRSEALTILDDRFEEFMVDYNDDQLGPGEMSGDRDMTEGPTNPQQSEYEQWLLQTAVEDFEKSFQAKLKISDVGELEREDVGDSEREDDDGDSWEEEEEETQEFVEIDETLKRERLDCESILSTYSTLYNHPTKIIDPRNIDSNIKLSKKTEMPLGVIPGPLPKENHPKRSTITRPKIEDKDEKKARKLAMKEDRKQRRINKKATKMAFKMEFLRQQKLILDSSGQTAAVV